MNLIQGINTFLGLILSSFRQFGKWKVWAILLGYFGLNWLLLFAHYKFYSPLFYGIISPWLSLFHTQEAVGFTHYPGHFITLPFFFGWAKFYMAILFEGSILGAVATLFYKSITDDNRTNKHTFGQLLLLWLQLTIAWFIINGTILLLSSILPDLFITFLHGSPRRVFAFNTIFLPFLYTFVLALFYYTIAAIAVYKMNLLKALGESLKLFRRFPLFTFFLSVCVLAVPVAISIITGYQNIIVEKFKPELIYWILFAGLVGEMFVNFFWMNTAVRFMIDQE